MVVRRRGKSPMKMVGKDWNYTDISQGSLESSVARRGKKWFSSRALRESKFCQHLDSELLTSRNLKRKKKKFLNSEATSLVVIYDISPSSFLSQDILATCYSHMLGTWPHLRVSVPAPSLPGTLSSRTSPQLSHLQIFAQLPPYQWLPHWQS